MERQVSSVVLSPWMDISFPDNEANYRVAIDCAALILQGQSTFLIQFGSHLCSQGPPSTDRTCLLAAWPHTATKSISWLPKQTGHKFGASREQSVEQQGLSVLGSSKHLASKSLSIVPAHLHYPDTCKTAFSNALLVPCFMSYNGLLFVLLSAQPSSAQWHSGSALLGQANCCRWPHL